MATRDQATGMETKLVADQAAAEDQYLDQVAAKLAGYVRHVRQAIARKVEDSQPNFDGLKEDFARAIAAADAAVPDKPAVKSGDSQDEVDAVKGLSLGLPLNDPGSLQKGLDDGFLTKNELTERLNWSGLVSRFNDLRGRLKTAMQKAQDDGMLLAKKLEIAGSPDVTTAEQCKTLFDAELAKVGPIAIEPFQLQYDLS